MNDIKPKLFKVFTASECVDGMDDSLAEETVNLIKKGVVIAIDLKGVYGLKNESIERVIKIIREGQKKGIRISFEEREYDFFGPAMNEYVVKKNNENGNVYSSSEEKAYNPVFSSVALESTRKGMFGNLTASFSSFTSTSERQSGNPSNTLAFTASESSVSSHNPNLPSNL